MVHGKLFQFARAFYMCHSMRFEAVYIAVYVSQHAPYSFGIRKIMSQFNISTFSQEDQDKVAVDLVASGVAYKERLNKPVVAEVVAREQPEHLREYFMERLRYYRQLSLQLPKASDPKYIEMEEANNKGKGA